MFFRIFLFVAMLIIPLMSQELSASVKIVVKNHFKKMGRRQFLADETYPRSFKICLSQNTRTCTETVSVMSRKSHEFDLSETDPKFHSAFDSNGNLKPESLIIYTEGLPCSNENNADKQFYPSQRIPYDENKELPPAKTIEVTLHRMSMGLKSWAHAYCSIRYKDSEGKSTLAIVNFAEVEDFCNADHENKVTAVGVYPYNGFLPNHHYIAKGVWNEDMNTFLINSIKLKDKWTLKKEFCDASLEQIVQANIVKLHEMKQTFYSLREWFETRKFINTLNILSSQNLLDLTVHLINGASTNLILDKKGFPLLPKEFNTFTLKDKNEILKACIKQAQNDIDEMSAEKSNLLFQDAANLLMELTASKDD